MLCEICGEREAVYHFLRDDNGILTEHWVCRECARKIRPMSWYEYMEKHADKRDAFEKLLTGMLKGITEDDRPEMHVSCPRCGMVFKEFVQVGKFGCPECYNVFGPLIEDNMLKIQAGTRHLGKKYQDETEQEEIEIPSVVKKIKAKGKKKKTEEGSKSEPLSLEELKAQMQKAVEAEDYEAAARFRDEYRLRKGQES